MDPSAATSLSPTGAPSSAGDVSTAAAGLSRRWLLLDAAVVFLGAFLLFLIQPAYSKFILPWFGGVPLVWATALVFFQCALLAGYAYAHLLIGRVPPRIQLPLHLILLVASLWFLPVEPGEQWKPAGGDAPTGRILLMLLATLGLPYVLLAATSPLVQAWIARYRHQIVPYRLFSLSNLASLLALVSYPFLIEPSIGLRLQFQAWAVLYAVYVAVMAALAFITGLAARKHSTSAPQRSSPSQETAFQARPAWRTQSLWVALAALPSLLFLATTQHLTLDVAPVPFLWVLPLVLYLLTFVICFEYPHRVPRRLLGFLSAVAATVMGLLVAMPFAVPDFRIALALQCGGLFVLMFYCHAELYARRPAPQFLTRFYLMTAFGGALGGTFVGLIAHHIFHGHYEIYAGLAGVPLLVFLLEWRRGRMLRGKDMELSFPMLVPLCAAALVASLPFVSAAREELRAARNFFGALRVIEGREHGLPAWRQLDHGSTKHGLQLLAPSKRCLPVAYYSPDSGIGRVMNVLGEQRPSLRVGVIGLGVGTLAAYARPADQFVFYEINPLVEQVAREDFSFLSECAEGVEVRIGDARIALEREAPNGFDVLVVDAFSGDSIPTHLLTHEAFRIYDRHLARDGIIIVNVSNRYLDLRPVVRAGAAATGRAAAFLGSQPDNDDHVFEALWALVSRDARLFDHPAIRNLSALTPQPRREVPWTDDFSNLFRVIQD